MLAPLPMYHQCNPTMGAPTLPILTMSSTAFSAHFQAALNSSGVTLQNQDASVPQTQTHCGHGQCRPCFEHIRGRCKLVTSCGYCHGEEHKIRRKQKKHE